MSIPSISSSSETRIPIVALSTPQTTRLAPNTHAKITAAPSNCAPKVASALLSGTTIRPKKPHTPWTEIAPTGSSIFSLSRPIMLNTTREPDTAPIATE
ncbi:Uncharacterised protein [Vibrio cholerae]|nr:Uncharacterised protein [Vibrio cholerae]CSB28310.1 Uncharacterised protein [Vibrio cholerae]CSD38128.1 Uncharacterised protein [Vibrio cholerae]